MRCPSRCGITCIDALVNLGEPVTLINDMLQARPRRAGTVGCAFVINSTIGIGGLFDVADGWGWKEHDSDAGITLAIWGMPDGVYLFLPILGPTNPRDAIGFGADLRHGLDHLGRPRRGRHWARLGPFRAECRRRARAGAGRSRQGDGRGAGPLCHHSQPVRQHRDATVENAREDRRATVPAWFPQPTSNPTH